MPKPEQQPAWKDLTRLATSVSRLPVAEMLEDDARNDRLRLELPGMLLDMSKQRLDGPIVDALLALARQQRLPEQIEGLFTGAHVNTTENRPALHTALRAASGDRPALADAAVEEALARLLEFARQVRSAGFRGHTGRAITHVVHIGIGGSNLGPELAVDALGTHTAGGVRCRFVANIDAEALTAALSGLDPATTLFMVVSKSFSTLETRVNSQAARSWFIERTANPDAIRHHFLAVTANHRAAADFGIADSMIYPMWDWVGGRYSLWSAVGLPIALEGGPEGFQSLLEGARDLDRHFRTAPLAQNGPVLMALTGVWNYNFLGAATLAVLPYDRRLRLLPAYLQQLEMESNGKSVHHDGTSVGVHSLPVVWGGEETNGQHSFHQLLHQGTRAFTADFILTTASRQDPGGHHRWLLANGLAQSQAMMMGEASDDPHRRVSGDKGTTTLVLERLTPYTLGALLALYEHKVFCQGVIWNINSFDQWGVEVGKRLALPIHEQLGGASAVQQDASTRYLIGRLRGRSGR